MKVGLVIPQRRLRSRSAQTMAFATAAEGMGYAHLTAFDFPSTEVAFGPELAALTDPLVLLAHLAAATAEIRLDAAIYNLPRRQAALFARQTAEVQIVSQGRLRLSVWAGEAEVAGWQKGSSAEQFFREQWEVINRLWTEPMVTFEGAFHKLHEVLLNPRPEAPPAVWAMGANRSILDSARHFAEGVLWTGRFEDALSVARDDHDENMELGVLLRWEHPSRLREQLLQWRDSNGSVATIALEQGGHSSEAEIDALASLQRAIEADGLLAGKG